MNEYEQILKKREEVDKEIELKYEKALTDLNEEQANIPVEKEIDDGHGYITFNIEKQSIETWQYPLDIKVDITSNAKQFSYLTKIPTICMFLFYIHMYIVCFTIY